MSKISQKTRVIIYIAIAIAVIVIGAMAVLSQKSGGESLLGEKLELGQQYLLELSYDKAVLEFTDAINIEPKSADAYIGLAEAYKGLGDTEKARETLEKGYELTGDERIKALLEELDKAEVVTAETTTAEITTTAVQSREYTNDELVEAVKLLMKDPDANVDQALLDSITTVYIWGDELISCESTWYLCGGGNNEFTLSYGDGSKKTYKRGHINDLNFLKRLHNVKTLEICYNEIDDISPISELKNLTYLTLGYNPISDISPLSGLKNLTFLNLVNNQISDISPLFGLTNLTDVYLIDNPISQTDIDNLKANLKANLPNTNIDF